MEMISNFKGMRVYNQHRGNDVVAALDNYDEVFCLCGPFRKNNKKSMAILDSWEKYLMEVDAPFITVYNPEACLCNCRIYGAYEIWKLRAKCPDCGGLIATSTKARCLCDKHKKIPT